MSANTYRTTVLEAWPPTPTTRLVRVELPEGFSTRPSESMNLTISGRFGQMKRELSIATGPDRPFLEFATRLSDSEFKRAFFALKPGDEVTLEGPVGSFPIDFERPAFFLAGGIGITTFRSALQAVADAEFNQKTALLYANSSPAEVGFMAELDTLARRAPNMEIFYTVSQASGDWSRFTGRIDKKMVQKALKRVPGARCYLAGPEGFVKAGAEILLDLGVKKDDIMLNDYPGYGNYVQDPEPAENDVSEPFRRMSWEERYENMPVEEMPWFRPDLDPDVDKVLNGQAVTGATALDLGTGPGTQAIALAKRGYRVTGTDISHTAVQKAAIRAKNEGAEVRFIQDDMLQSKLGEHFDLVLDRGCFHTIDPDHRKGYIKTLRGLVNPGGTVILKCFSYKETRPGPNRFTPKEIRTLFGDLFDIESIDETAFRGGPVHTPLALVCVMHPKNGQK